eukprot:3788305-Rhodomonas_salina.1
MAAESSHKKEVTRRLPGSMSVAAVKRMCKQVRLDFSVACMHKCRQHACVCSWCARIPLASRSVWRGPRFCRDVRACAET